FSVVRESDFPAGFRVDNEVGGGGRFGWVRVLEEYEVRLALGIPPDVPTSDIPTPAGYYFLRAQQIERDAGELDPRLYPEAASQLAELEATTTTLPRR